MIVEALGLVLPYFEYRIRGIERSRKRRRRWVVRRRMRRGRVRRGRVETVYSIVVGEGRRVWR